MLESWHKTRQRLHLFWDNWATEYLTALKEQHRKRLKLQRYEPAVDDVVMIQPTPAHAWGLGRVIRVISPRHVEIQIPNGKSIIRSVKQLAPILHATANYHSNINKILQGPAGVSGTNIDNTP